MIGIIGAMDLEVDGLKQKMENTDIDIIGNLTFYRGTLCGVECVVAQSGIGKVNAAMCTQTMILQYNPAFIVHTGVAGGIGSGVRVGDVVLSSGLVQHDFDTTSVGDELGLLPMVNRVIIPVDEEWLALVEKEARMAYDGAVHVGIIATGDQFIGSAAKLRKIHQEFAAIACEMEGGAVAQVCYLNQVDFVVVRAISDNADEEAQVSFQEFAAESAKKALVFLEHLLPKVQQALDAR